MTSQRAPSFTSLQYCCRSQMAASTSGTIRRPEWPYYASQSTAKLQSAPFAAVTCSRRHAGVYSCTLAATSRSAGPSVQHPLCSPRNCQAIARQHQDTATWPGCTSLFISFLHQTVKALHAAPWCKTLKQGMTDPHLVWDCGANLQAEPGGRLQQAPCIQGPAAHQVP